MNTQLINNLRSLNRFFEIDFQFADFIISKEELDHQEKENFYLATLCLSHYANCQHSVLPLQIINGQKMSQFLRLDTEEQASEDEIFDLILDFSNFQKWPKIFSKTLATKDEFKPLIIDLDIGALYLNKYYRAETFVAEFIRKRSHVRHVSDHQKKRLEIIFDRTHDENPPKTDWQKAAAFMALRSNFCVISGGPGTGKTTTVGRILSLLLEEEKDFTIHLVAPTGKAADRLTESIIGTKEKLRKSNIPDEILNLIPTEASTIHRYLGYHGGSKKFRHNSDHRTESDLLLIDEASMVDLPLFRYLLSSLRDNCRVILLGDKDQLTAVDTGNVLGDLTSADAINTFSESFCNEFTAISGETFNFSGAQGLLADCIIKLQHSYRFTSDSGIGQLAYFINNATVEEYDSEKLDEETQSMLQLIERFPDKLKMSDTPEKINDTVEPDSEGNRTQEFLYEYKNALSNFRKISQKLNADLASDKVIFENEVHSVVNKLNQFRILCATRKGKYGAENINKEISKAAFGRNDQSLYQGRCIMIRKNNKALDLYNGDVGVLLKNLDGNITAYFPSENGTVIAFSPTILPEFETAFAMTIHKSQGSEYNDIRIILPIKENELLTKELIYTGITRAKNSVEISSKPQFIIKAAKRKTQRFSGLAERLK